MTKSENFPEIETARLILRMYEIRDVDAIHAIWNDPDVTRYFPPEHRQRTKEQVSERLSRLLQRWRERGYGQWAVVLKDDKKLIGYCGLQPLDKTTQVEIFYGFPRQYWGKGFATEAARAALRYAFEEIKLPRVAAVTHPENAASQKVLQKISFKSEGEKRIYEMNLSYFSLSQEEYAATKQSNHANKDFFKLRYVSIPA